MVGPMAPRLVLASASPARLRLLREAGFDPDVAVSGVDEAAVIAELGPGAVPTDVVEELAVRKAAAVASIVPDALVVGCDSMLELDGEVLGRPTTAPTRRHGGGTGGVAKPACSRGTPWSTAAPAGG